MALLLALLLLFLGGGTTTSGGSVAQAQTSLAITVWPRGPSGRSLGWTLRCAPPGGTLPEARTACRRLQALEHPFAPVPEHTACTALYGGPQTARVRGTFRQHRVDARFNRKDGCEIARWDRVRFLFPIRR